MSTANARLHDERLDELVKFIRVIHEPGDTFELRILGIRSGRFENTAAGYFRDPYAAARAALVQEKRPGAAVYLVMNHVNPECYPRKAEAIEDGLKKTTSDSARDILRRRRIVFDIDPERPAGVSATAEKYAAAVRFTDRLRDCLREEHGWPDPILGGSGNGCTCIYAVDLPNDKDSAELVKRVLAAAEYHAQTRLGRARGPR